MARPLTTLGINSAHDASACMLIDGQLHVAVSEERLSRRKHHEGFPYLAVEYCLRAGELYTLGDVDCVVLNQYAEADFELELRNTTDVGRLVVNPSHHLLHAYYAWVASGFQETAVMIVDGSGYSYGEYSRRNSSLIGDAPPFSEMEEAESLYVTRDGSIEIIRKRWALWEASQPFYRFASLGHMYSMASQYIFGHMRHAGKTMGLAPYGDPSSFPDPLVVLDGDEMVIETEWASRLPPRSAAPAHLDPVCCDLAAKVQAELERAMLHLAARLYHETRQDRLVISGGVGLNSVTNGRILRESPFSELFVTPAAGDAGISIGAALYGHELLTGRLPTWSYRDDYHGRRYTPAEVESTIAVFSGRARVTAADAAAQAAQDLARGLVVGWFEGRSEFGPRALGHRSILADPRDEAMRSHLNDMVKFREPFRPYAASVLAEHAATYFDIDVDDPFMLIVAPVREEHRASIPSVCHVDGTCRIQTVSPDQEGEFRHLIECFYKLTGLPLLLNTSFNIRGEPIVETPEDALECFLATNIDVLYLEGRRITKELLQDSSVDAALVPRLNDGLSLGSVVGSRDGRALEPKYYVESKTGYRSPISEDEFALLCAVDGLRTVHDIGCPAGDAQAALTRLQLRGVVSFLDAHPPSEDS